jgi:hypothetical protein
VAVSLLRDRSQIDHTIEYDEDEQRQGAAAASV